MIEQGEQLAADSPGVADADELRHASGLFDGSAGGD